jgi:4-carboxymuconolactone decarboxylase
MREHFTEKQLVEITALLTVVNLDRFNAAFGIGSAGFSEGMVCLVPERPANTHADGQAPVAPIR